MSMKKKTKKSKLINVLDVIIFLHQDGKVINADTGDVYTLCEWIEYIESHPKILKFSRSIVI